MVCLIDGIEAILRRNGPTQGHCLLATFAAGLLIVGTTAELSAQRRNVILAIDHSSSMDDNDPGQSRFRVGARFVESLRSQDTRVGLVLFGGVVDASRSVGLTVDVDLVVAALGAVTRNFIDGTNFDVTITDAVRRFGENSDPADRNEVILLTDGVGDFDNRTALAAADRGIVIHTIGFGITPDSDAEVVLRSIAAITGAKYLFAPDPSFLATALSVASQEGRGNEVADPFGTPVALFLQPAQRSALVGNPVEVRIYLLDRDDLPVPADRDYDVTLAAEGADVLSDSVVRIAERARYGTTLVAPTQPGPITLRARTSGLGYSDTEMLGCASGSISRLILTSAEERTLLPVMTPHALRLVFADSANTPVTDGTQKVPELSIDGVGVLGRLGSNVVGAEECEAQLELQSDQAGRTVVGASIGDEISTERRFTFYRVLHLGLFLMVLLGALGGGFVQAARNWRGAQRWGRNRWFAYGLSSGLTGVAVFLFSYYIGLRALSPELSASLGVGFLLGLIGGYLGPTALDRVSSVLLPAGGADNGSPEAPGRRDPNRRAIG